MGSTKPRAAYSAAFSPDAASVFVASERRVTRLDLVPKADAPPQMRKAWSAQLLHASSLAPAPSGGVLIVTNTSGKHFGLDIGTGRQLWETDTQEEGDKGLFLDDGSFLYIDWNGGVRRLSPKTGQDIDPVYQIGHKVRAVQRLGRNGAVGLIRLRAAGGIGKPAANEFCAFTPETGTCDVLLNVGACTVLTASPDGALVASVESVDEPGAKPSERPRRLAVTELSTGNIVIERLFEGPERPRGTPTWTRDATRLTCASRSGYHLLVAETLESEALVPSNYGYKAEISSDGRLVFLCDWECAKLLRLADLASY